MRIRRTRRLPPKPKLKSRPKPKPKPPIKKVGKFIDPRKMVGGPGYKPPKPPAGPAPSPGASKPTIQPRKPLMGGGSVAKPKPRVRSKPRVRKAVTRRRRVY